MSDSVDQEVLDDADAFVEGHLGEAALVLVADGAGALLGARAREHAESCPVCASHIAEQALAAAEVHVAFTGMSKLVRERLVLDAAATPSRIGARTVRRAELERGLVGLTEPKGPDIAPPHQWPTTAAVPGVEAAAASRRNRAAGGGFWIAAGLIVAGLAAAPSLSGVAKGISELRDALLVIVAVSVQAEQALRIASGRMEIVRTTASWTAALAMIGVGLWIARRDPKRTKVQETKEAEAGGAR